MKKILFIILALFHTICALCQTNVLELKGKHIIIPPNIKIQQGSFYTPEVLKKMKFEDKYAYNNIIFGDTLFVTNSQHLNVGDKKNEIYLLELTHNQTPIVFYIPMYIDSEDNRVYTNFFTKGKREPGFSSVKIAIPSSSVIIPYYDVDLMDSISKHWSNKLLYPNGHQGIYTIERGNFKFNWLKETEPYIFYGFEFAEDRESRGYNFETLFAVFTNRFGAKHYYKIIPCHTYIKDRQVHTDNNSHTLAELSNQFITDEELVNYCIRNSNQALIDNIINNYVGKEFYIDPSLVNKIQGERAFNINNPNSGTTNWGDGYFTLDKVEILPSRCNKPYYNYFAIVSNSENNFAIPIIDDFFDLIVDAESHRAEIEAINSRLESERREEEIRIQRETQQYKSDLIKRYGSTNANLILDGRIRLGFSKAMVKEAWGNPYDTMTVSNYYGSVECWIYGMGTYVYFQGNKVVQIID